MVDYTLPNLERAALITIDVQNDFTLPGAVAEINGTYERLSEMQAALHLMREAGRPIVHVVRLYNEDGSNADLCRRAALASGKKVVAPGSDGAELVSALLPPGCDARLDAELLLRGEFQQLGDREWAMYKPRWGAFYGTDLEPFLRGLDVDTVVVIGCNFPNCPRTTVYEASERDFRIALIRDAMSGVYDRGVDELRNIGVHVWTLEQLSQQL